MTNADDPTTTTAATIAPADVVGDSNLVLDHQHQQYDDKNDTDNAALGFIPSCSTSTTTTTTTATVTTSSPSVTVTSESELLYRQTEARMQEIEEQVKQSPLTSVKQPIDVCLKEQYKEAPNFLQQINLLMSPSSSSSCNYSHFRTVRGDGNCYYRAFLYSLLEQIATGEEAQKQEGERLLQWLKTDSWKEVLSIGGYSEIAMEAFYDTMVDVLERVLSGSTNLDALHEEMNQESSTADYCTWYLRVVTATHLKKDPDRFLPFLFNSSSNCYDMIQFCQREVEPMGRECEQVQVLALAEAMQVSVSIAYLDGHATDTVSRHVFGPEESSLKLHFLYRPGHYDILYPQQQQKE